MRDASARRAAHTGVVTREHRGDDPNPSPPNPNPSPNPNPNLVTPGEPRRAVPHETVEAIIDLVEAHYLHDFFAVQMVFFILVLYTSFSRTECPCPKTYAGREESGEEEDETVSVQYRRPPGPRAGDSPEPLRYWFQAGHRPVTRDQVAN